MQPYTSTPAASSTSSTRVLACTQCQVRKIKCDRTFPCSQCLKSGSQCIPSTRLPRQRRRRFAERDLLQKLRQYECLLKEHDIQFEPLHPDHEVEPEKSHVQKAPNRSDASRSSFGAATPPEPEQTFEAKSFWSAMNAGFRDGDDEDSDEYDNLQYASVRKTWDQMHPYSDQLFFGAANISLDLSPLQPSSIQIIQLFQIYQDNVNPLLKLTHTPTLQGRIIEAASNTQGIGRELEALMFAIYCMAITSLTEEQCQGMFNTTKSSLLTGFQFGCQQALAKCEFLRTINRDCLTALYLYLLSATPFTDPRSLSSMLGIVVRTAQRLELNSETENVSAGPLEGELRRRLWWAIVIFDARISEMSNHKEGISLAPTWDCAVPTNVSEYELRAESKTMPKGQTAPTDAIFTAVRGEMGRYVRRTNFHLDFTNPALKKLAPVDRLARQLQASSLSDASEMDELEENIEAKYLRHCDEDVPLQFFTMWYARGYMARCRLTEFYSKCAMKPSEMMSEHSSPASSDATMPSEAQRDDAFQNALHYLEHDTKIMMSPLTQGFLWLMEHSFPIIAYFHVIQVLRRKPLHTKAQWAWDTMDANFEARFVAHRSPRDESENPLVHFFNKVVLGAWAAREMAFATQSSSLDPLPSTPKIVQGMRKRMEGRGPVGGVSIKTESMASGATPHPFLMGAEPTLQPPDFSNASDLPAGLMDMDASMQMGMGGDMSSNTFDTSLYPFDFSSMYTGSS